MSVMTRLTICLTAAIAVVANAALTAPVRADDNPFASQVRSTEPLAPAEQLKLFHLPPGFEIELVAAEPDIQKPMNLAFDARGRLWVSGSVEYPYAAAEGEGRDSIRVLEDADGDGCAETVTVFADGLNIPIGLYPYRDGVVAYSIPDITFFRDTDGDGRADRRERLFGLLGQPVDTHGMQNAFRRGFDGWLYINHGFRNDSTITARDGSSIQLNSGNTYRVRLDGSRVEQFTWGQVNPFGSTFTPDGDLLTTDCHSKPLSLLLRGGYYSSFGKPHDGLGFVPPVMEHGHGSTALAGAAYCDAAEFPESYRGSIFLGNVMTCRVHRDRLERRGSTLVAVEQEDFLTCDDPWFRPVDLQMGPDGALYIADFYNRVIGHYEVPLDHPGRDRSRGRIWRVVYRGDPGGREGDAVGDGDNVPPPVAAVDLSEASVDKLLVALDDASLTRRMLATDQLSDRIGPGAVDRVRRAIGRSASAFKKIHGLWTLHRLGAVSADDIERLADDDDSLVRTHAIRVLAEQPRWTEALFDRALAALHDDDPGVRRAAAEALSQSPGRVHQPAAPLAPTSPPSPPDAPSQASARCIDALLAAVRATPADDVHLQHMLQIALRNHLRQLGAFSQLAASDMDDADRERIADVALAVPSAEAAEFLTNCLSHTTTNTQQLAARLEHAAAHASPELIDRLVALVRTQAATDVDRQLQLLRSLQSRLDQRGLATPPRLREWGAELAVDLLASVDAASATWRNLGPNNPWDLEPRRTAGQASDDASTSLFLSSLPGGEQHTARLRSPTFVMPNKLRFDICGHRGFPRDAASDANLVRLRLADSDEVLRQVFPPRNDTAQPVIWELSAVAGREAYLEVVDGLSLNAYAWLAIANIEPPVVSVPKLGPRTVAQRQQAAAAIVATLRHDELLPDTRALLVAESTDPTVRKAAAEAVLAVKPLALAAALLPALADPAVGPALQLEIARGIASDDPFLLIELASSVRQRVPSRVQQAVALDMASSLAGAQVLLELVERGTASARLLQSPTVQLRMKATSLPGVAATIDRLTAALPPTSEEVESLVKQRRSAFSQTDADIVRGRQVFEKHCAACHQIAGQGAVVGPQLDGIGNRGLERVLEDVLDPNRNIDAAFHVSVLVTNDGRVLTGLYRREEDESLILAGNDGKEFAVLKANIDEQHRMPTSLMPDNFGTAIPTTEFLDLTAYLMSLRQAPQPSSEP